MGEVRVQVLEVGGGDLDEAAAVEAIEGAFLVDLDGGIRVDAVAPELDVDFGSGEVEAGDERGSVAGGNRAAVGVGDLVMVEPVVDEDLGAATDVVAVETGKGVYC